MRIYVGSDHRGFELKEKIKKWLRSQGYGFEDVGALAYEPNDDYPLYTEKVGRAVSTSRQSKGILLCGSGVGAVAAANKIRGVIASVGFLPEQVKAGRHDDDMNVLVLAADFISQEQAIEIITAFLTTSFDKTQERYQRRIDQIKVLEQDG